MDPQGCSNTQIQLSCFPTSFKRLSTLRVITLLPPVLSKHFLSVTPVVGIVPPARAGGLYVSLNDDRNYKDQMNFSSGKEKEKEKSKQAKGRVH
eukprot:1158805-Pelagomonas_calceolata.AAC.6